MVRNGIAHYVVVGLSVASVASAGAQAAGKSPLRLESKIELGDVAGRVDHMAIDVGRKRLFVAELGNDSVSVVDLDSKKVIKRFLGLSEPQGIGYLPANDSLYIANGGDGSLRIFHGPEYVPAGRIDLGADADNVRVDSARNRILVGYGDGAIAIIDSSRNSKENSLPLQAHPESFQLDPADHRVFANVPNKRLIAVLNEETGQTIATWPMPHGGNFAMVLDPQRRRVLVAFRSPSRLAAVDGNMGSIVTELDTCGDIDDLFVDQKRSRVYLICGSGFIDVLHADAERYKRIAQLPTAIGARTGLFVPELDLLLLGVRGGPRRPTAIWVYKPDE